MHKLFIVLLVFLVVFKPEDLPRFIKFVNLISLQLYKIKQNMVDWWDSSLQKDLQLNANIKKAEEADLLYSEDNNSRQSDKNK